MRIERLVVHRVLASLTRNSSFFVISRFHSPSWDLLRFMLWCMLNPTSKIQVILLTCSTLSEINPDIIDTWYQHSRVHLQSSENSFDTYKLNSRDQRFAESGQDEGICFREKFKDEKKRQIISQTKAIPWFLFDSSLYTCINSPIIENLKIK